MFEFTASIPVVKDLKIAVMDYDLIGRDDLIGETQIDLEQRMLSRYFATCGCSKTYCKYEMAECTKLTTFCPWRIGVLPSCNLCIFSY